MFDQTIELEMRSKAMLDDEDVARLFGVSVRTAQDRARRGKFPKPLFGGKQKEKRVWSSTAFFRWIETNGRTDR